MIDTIHSRNLTGLMLSCLLGKNFRAMLCFTIIQKLIIDSTEYTQDTSVKKYAIMLHLTEDFF